MEIVKKIVTNIWFQTLVSVLCAIYTIVLCYFAYAVFFYEVEYVDKMRFAIIYSAFSIVVGLLHLYTRRSVLTCTVSMLNMLVFFPTLMMDWGNWPLLIPAAIVTLFGFFSCKMNDTLKTIFGTIFLLLYVVGGIAFFLIMNVFRVTTVDTLLTPGAGIVSESENFRCYVLDVQNKFTGKVAVYVQPNKLDKDIDFVSIKLKTTIKKLVKQAIKENKDDAFYYDVHWEGSKLYINGEEYFDERDFLTTDENGDTIYELTDDVWVHTYFDVDYPIIDLIDQITQIVSDTLHPAEEDTETTEETGIPEVSINES